MDEHGLAQIILGDEHKIADAISMGAAWEVWMQVELALLMMRQGFGVAREVPYPPPVASWRIDLVVTDRAGPIGIELKVESANDAAGLPPAFTADLVKVASFRPNASRCWALAIGYSAPAKAQLAAWAQAHGGAYAPGVTLGVLVASAPVDA